MSDLIVEQRRGQNRHIKNQSIGSNDEHTNCQDLKIKNISDKSNYHWPIVGARSNATEIARDLIPKHRCCHHLARNQTLEKSNTKKT